MDANPGKELLNTLNTLGIDRGSCTPNVIEGWFDIDPQSKDFLIWISKNLSHENLIFAYERAEYEENIKRGGAHKKDEEFLMKEISEKLPGIYDIEETEFEIECLEEKLTILLQDKSKLDNILRIHEDLSKREKSSLLELENELDTSTNDFKKATENCISMSYQLDNANNKLYASISQCSEKLLEFECLTSTSYTSNLSTIDNRSHKSIEQCIEEVGENEYPSSTTYISNLPLNKYYNQCKYIGLYFDLLEKKELVPFPKLQSAVKTCRKLDGSILHEKSVNKLKNLPPKLFKSIQNRNYIDTIKEQSQAELNYLNNFNMHELLNNVSSKQDVVNDIQIKNDLYEILSIELENLSVEVSLKYIDLPSLAISKNELNFLGEKLNSIKKVESIFLNIFAYHITIYFMLVINNIDIQRLEEFLRSVYNYIARNLTKCELRTKSMVDIIEQYRSYNELALKEKNPLVQAMFKFSTNELHQDDGGPVKLQHLHYPKQLRLIEQNNKVLKCFISNRPTSEITVLPFVLYQMIKEIDNILTTKSNAISTTVSIWNDTTKRASKDNWFRYKRQLWSYFLIQPQKVLLYIEKIKEEEQRFRAQL